MAIYKLILADTPGVEGTRGYPRLLEVKKLGRLAEVKYRLGLWLKKGGKTPPTAADPPLKEMLDGSFEIAVPVPPHVKDSLVYDLIGVRMNRPVRIVFCFDGRKSRATEV